MLEDRIAQMRTAVDLLVGMAQTLQDEVAAGKMTLAEAQTQFRQRGRRHDLQQRARAIPSPTRPTPRSC